MFSFLHEYDQWRGQILLICSIGYIRSAASNGYSAPYTVFGIIAAVGGLMIFAMKEKKEEDSDEDIVTAY